MVLSYIKFGYFRKVLKSQESELHRHYFSWAKLQEEALGGGAGEEVGYRKFL